MIELAILFTSRYLRAQGRERERKGEKGRERVNSVG